MCLFKRDEQENNCVHEECKNYYLLNKQICMYSKQNQEVKLPKPNEEQNLLELLQKKIKKETDSKPYVQETPVHSIYQNNQGFTLNPAVLAQKVQVPVKTEVQNSSGIFFPLLSQHHNIQQSLHTPVAETTTPGNFSNMSLSQLINLRNQNSLLNSLSNTTKTSEPSASESNQASDSSVKDFQNKLLSLILSQNKVLVELKEKNDLLQDTMTCLVGEISSLKKCIKTPIAEALPIASGNPTALFPQIIGNSSDTINTECLMTYLYGPNPEFQYQIVFKQEFSLPLYRERNFKFTVTLVDKNGNIVDNSNRIPLSIGIYSSENPPKYIDSNTSGNKILKGFIEKDLVHGTATFEKIQIKEVTSHFRNGWVFFVVYPKIAAGANIVTVDGNLNFVNSQKIKPLVLEKVIVKAKKTKEKDNAADVEGQDEMEQDKEEVVYSNN